MKKIFLIFLTSILLFGCRDNYKSNLANCTRLMDEVSSKSIVVCEFYEAVWANAIYNQKDHNGNYCNDFSVALDMCKSQADLTLFGTKEKRDSLKIIIKELNNYPSKYKEDYNEIISLYADVEQLAEYAEKPTGSYKTYSENVSDLSFSINKRLKKLKIKYVVEQKTKSSYPKEEKEKVEFNYVPKMTPVAGFNPNDYIGKEFVLLDSCIFSNFSFDFQDCVKAAKSGDWKTIKNNGGIFPKGTKVRIISSGDEWFEVKVIGEFEGISAQAELLTVFIEQSSIF